MHQTTNNDKKGGLSRVNNACQRAHPLAIDLFLIMVVVASLILSHYSVSYEVVPDRLTSTALVDGEEMVLYNYQPQTDLPLITESEWEAIKTEKKSFHNRLTIFGVIIFLLYGYTQRQRWSKKVSLIRQRFQSGAK